jgi:amino acid transporter
MMLSKLTRKKSILSLQRDIATGSQDGGIQDQKRVLNVRDLTLMGIAAVIGAGIFSTIGKASFDGGPGVIFLFIITAVTCGFTALCYAEFAARIPVSGSAYTYSYVAFGELIAWIIGWALILEYAIGNIVVAISWSGYFTNVLSAVGVYLPAWMVTDPKTAHDVYLQAVQSHADLSSLAWTVAPQIANFRLIFNLPAFLIVGFISILAYIGIKESKRSANAMVIVKLLVLLLVVMVGYFYINTDNYTPFFPNHFSGVLKGVSAVFYAYIGFDAISTTAEECKNPQRDLPRGMLYSLLICTVIYIVTALVITGMVPYYKFEHVTDPLAFVFNYVGQDKLGKFISFSAVVAATSVLLVFQIGQPRIWMSMSRDGLLPKAFSKMHKKFKTPYIATLIAGAFVAIPSLFINIDIVTDLTSIGTLFAFVIVCAGVLTLAPALPEQRFKLPYINGRVILPVLFAVFIATFRDRIVHIAEAHDWLFLLFLISTCIITLYTIAKKWSLIPILGLLCCMYLMIEIPVNCWKVFIIWMLMGLMIYFLYGYKKSKLNNTNA